MPCGVLGLRGLAPGTTPPPPSPRPCEVIDPPTNSVATGLRSLSSMRTSPAMNVWMSPVTNTTSSIFLLLDVLQQLACARAGSPATESKPM